MTRKTLAENTLLGAVNAYITTHDGAAAILGPTVVMHLPGDPEYVYYLAVKFTGKKPTVTS